MTMNETKYTNVNGHTQITNYSQYCGPLGYGHHTDKTSNI